MSRTPLQSTVLLEQHSNQDNDESEPEPVHREYLFGRRIGLEKHVGFPLEAFGRSGPSELDVRLGLVVLVDKEAVQLRRKESQHHDAKEHERRIVDFKHFLLRKVCGVARSGRVPAFQ